MGIDEVATEPVTFGRLTAAEVESDLEPIRNVRLLNPTQMLSRFTFDRGEVAGLQDRRPRRRPVRDRRQIASRC